VPVPDYPAAIAGARAWRVAPNLWARQLGLLWSMAMTHPWENAKTIAARCERQDHEAPEENCSCGVYAWYTVDNLIAHGMRPMDHETISGVVAGWGGVIRGYGGYWVAEKVEVMAFFEDGHPSPQKEVLPGTGVYLPTKEECAEVWSVPVIAYSEYEEFCRERNLILLDSKGELIE